MPGWHSPLSVQRLISAEVMISGFMSLSPVSGSALTVQSLLGILSLLLSAPPLLVLSHFQNKLKNIFFLKKKRVVREEKRKGGESGPEMEDPFIINN